MGVEAFPNMLRGMFSFVLYDKRDNSFIAVRDHMGITPLYIGFNREEGSTWFASEMKAFNAECAELKSFPPGEIAVDVAVDALNVVLNVDFSCDSRFNRFNLFCSFYCDFDYLCSFCSVAGHYYDSKKPGEFTR